jgi:uncharacterized membrane protein
MEINSQAPAYYTAQIVINAPIEIVWEILSDIPNWPMWNPDVETVAMREPLAPGATFKWKAGGSSLASQLLVVEAPTIIGWSGEAMSIRAKHVFRLVRDGNQTIVTTEESFEGLLASLLRKYMQGVLRTTLDKNLVSLKTACEEAHKGPR